MINPRRSPSRELNEAHACPPGERVPRRWQTYTKPFLKKGQATDASGRSHNLVKIGSPKPDKDEHPNQAKNTAILR